jgi:hypothetical protein
MLLIMKTQRIMANILQLAQTTATITKEVAASVIEEVPDIDPETITEKKPLEARDTPASAGDNLSSEEVDKW